MKAVLKNAYLNLRGMLLNGLGLFFSRGAAPSYASPAKILFIRIDRIGDMVLSTPAIWAVGEKYPSAELCVLASPVTAPLLSADPRVKRVIVWDPSRGRRGALETLRKLREARFDLAIDPCADYELKTALIAFASGAAVRAGSGLYGRGIFFNLKAAPPKERGHFVEEAFEVLKLLGIERAGREPELSINGGAEAEALAFLKNSGAEEHAFLAAVHPGGSYPSQRWHPGGFAEVIRGLIEKRGAKILLIGGGPERDLVGRIAAAAAQGPDKKNIIKVIDFKTDVLAALLRKCRLFIGNNSGPLHMAAALKIPSISTMGPTDPVRWSPLGPEQVVLRTKLPCAPCGGVECGRDCMTDITAGMALESVERLLKI